MIHHQMHDRICTFVLLIHIESTFNACKLYLHVEPSSLVSLYKPFNDLCYTPPSNRQTVTVKSEFRLNFLMQRPPDSRLCLLCPETPSGEST